MKYSLLCSLLLLFVVVLLPIPALAQQSDSTDEKKTEKATREKAYNLLESLAREIGTLQSGENRARMASNIAESLWTHNESKSRELFASVSDELRAVLQSGPAINSSPDDLKERTFMVFLKLREDTVERIAKHDPEWALSFLKETRPRRANAESDKALELRLATLVAEKNPALALKLGQQLLKRGLSTELLDVLSQVGKKSPDHASEFYKTIVAEIRNHDIVEDWAALEFAQSLAVSYVPRTADQFTFRDLMNVFINAALANGCGQKAVPEEKQSFCYNIGNVIPLMEKVEPRRTASLKRFVQREQLESTPGESEMAEVSRDGTVDEMVALVAKYPNLSDSIYARAIIKARASGDLDKAREVVNESNLDAQEKREFLNQLDMEQQLVNMSDEMFARIQAALAEIKMIDEKVNLLFALIAQIGSRNRKVTLRILDQASGLIDSAQPGKWQMQAKIGLATKYCLEKSDRCFTIIEPLVAQLNELIASAVKLDQFDNNYLRDGEWNMTAEGGVGSLPTMLANHADYFAWYDFDRSVDLAARFERPEIRMMAQMKVAQGVLSGTPARPPTYYMRP